MEPSLKNGQYVLINKLDDNFKIGDIVVIHLFDKEYLAKRIIADGGDKLEINDAGIYINDIKLEESYIEKAWIKEDFLEVIPLDHVYVLGDNRDESFDSRNIGAIKKKRYEVR